MSHDDSLPPLETAAGVQQRHSGMRTDHEQSDPAAALPSALSAADSDESGSTDSEEPASAPHSAAPTMWERPAPRFGPFEKLTFKALETAFSKKQIAAQRGADGGANSDAHAKPAGRANSKIDNNAATPPKAKSKKKIVADLSNAKLETLPLPAGLTAPPISFDDMLANEKDAAKRASWFEWARGTWKLLGEERSKRLGPNRRYKMKNNLPPPPPPAPVVRQPQQQQQPVPSHLQQHLAQQLHGYGPAMAFDPFGVQFASYDPHAAALGLNHAALMKPPMKAPGMKAGRASPSTLAARPPPPPPVVAPPPRPPPPVVMEDTKHSGWNTKPLPRVAAAVSASAEFQAFENFPQRYLSSVLMLYDFIHVYSKQMPLEFPMAQLTLQSFLESFLIEPPPLPLPSAEDDEAELAVVANDTSLQKQRANGADSAVSSSPVPSSRRETPAVSATETPAPSSTAAALPSPVAAATPMAIDQAPSAEASASPVAAAAASVPAAADAPVAAAPAVAASTGPSGVKLEDWSADNTEMKDIDESAAAASPSAAAAASPVSPSSTYPALPLPPPSELRESHLFNSLMALIVRCLFASSKISVDLQRVVNRLTWPEHLRVWLVAEENIGALRGLRDVAELLAVDSFYYLSVSKRLHVVDVLLEHIFSGQLVVDLMEAGVHAFTAAKAAAHKTKTTELANKKLQEQNMLPVAETLYLLIEKVVAGDGHAPAKDTSGMGLSVILNSRNGLCTQGMKMLQDNYELRRDQTAAALIAVEQSSPVRTEPLGMDRYKNRYWALAQVKRPEDKQPVQRLFVELCGSNVNGDGSSGPSSPDRPAWLYYSTDAEYRQLLSWLNQWGTRERALREALLKINWAFVTPKDGNKRQKLETASSSSPTAAKVEGGMKMEDVGAAAAASNSSSSSAAPAAAAIDSAVVYSYSSCLELNLPLLRASEVLRKSGSNAGVSRCSTCQDALTPVQKHCSHCHRTWEADELSATMFQAHSQLCKEDKAKNNAISPTANPDDATFDALDRAAPSVIDHEADRARGYSDRRLFSKRMQRAMTVYARDEGPADEDANEEEDGQDDDDFEPEPKVEGAADAASADKMDENDGEPNEDAARKVRVRRRLKRVTPLPTCLLDASLTFHQLKAMMFDIESAIPLNATNRRVGKSQQEKARMQWMEPIKLTHSLKQLSKSLQALAENLQPQWLRSWFKLEDWSRAVGAASTEAQFAALLFSFDKALIYSQEERDEDDRRAKGVDLKGAAAGAGDSADEEAGGGSDDEDEDVLTGCMVCNRSDKPTKILICDTCDREIHMSCIRPPLKTVPKARFDCPSCRRRILRESKRGRTLEEAQEISANLARIHNARQAKLLKQKAKEAKEPNEPPPLPNGGICTKCNIDDGIDPLLCDGCNRAFHMLCLEPPLAEVPEGDWFCKNCTAAGITQSPAAAIAAVAAAAAPKKGRKGAGAGKGGKGGKRASASKRKADKFVDDEAGSDEGEEDEDEDEEPRFKTDSEESDPDVDPEEDFSAPKAGRKRAPTKAQRNKVKQRSKKAGNAKAAAALKKAAARKRKRRQEEEEEEEEEEEAETSSSESEAEPNSSSSETGDEEEVRCTVCFESSAAGRVSCDGCGIVAHRSCLGGDVPSEGWMCAACTQVGGEADCELCPFTSKQAVVKPLATPGKYAHQCCIEWMPGLEWTGADKSTARGLENVDELRRGVVCVICSAKSRGFCLSCIGAGGQLCQQKFHVLCGMKKRGYAFSKDQRGVRAVCPTHAQKK